MDLSRILGLMLAGLGGWMAGAVWYGVLGPRWLGALGKTKQEMAGPDGKPDVRPFLLAYVVNVGLAFVLWRVVDNAGGAWWDAWLFSYVGWAVLLWFGFILGPVAVMYAFSQRKPALTWIDAGHWLVALLAIGAVHAVMR